MFSLIISIIAIALVAALALASIYYGGAAFQEGSTDAEASTVINQGQQIQGAVTLADVDEVVVTVLDTHLAPKYMKEIPSVREEEWAFVADAVNGDRAEVKLYEDPTGGSDYVLADVCKAINEEAGLTDVTTDVDKGQFGCKYSATVPVAWYKL